MILATHALVGAAIGKNINSHWIIIILSLTMHFAMDSFRHGEYFDFRYAKIKDTWWKIALDLLIGLIIIYSFINFEKLDVAIIKNIAIGSFFSILPDGLTLLFWKYPKLSILEKIKQFHSWAHYYAKFPKYSSERQWNLRNATNDIAISLLATLLLFL
jgi:hypothetical protein